MHSPNAVGKTFLQMLPCSRICCFSPSRIARHDLEGAKAALLTAMIDVTDAFQDEEARRTLFSFAFFVFDYFCMIE